MRSFEREQILYILPDLAKLKGVNFVVSETFALEALADTRVREVCHTAIYWE